MKHARTDEETKKILINRSFPEPNTGCWIWSGPTRGKIHYGVIGYKGKYISTHRLSYQLFKRRIPKGKDILHKCDTPLCINPHHLSSGTHTDNMRDCLAKGRNKFMIPKTHCKRSHEYTKESTRIRKKYGFTYKVCTICEKELAKKYVRRSHV